MGCLKGLVTVGVLVNLLSGCSGGGGTDDGTQGRVPVLPNHVMGYACIDQVGRGQGDLLSGSTPTPAGWPNQASSPVYVWNNTGYSEKHAASDNSHILTDRDYRVGMVKPGYTAYTYPHPLVVSTPGPTRTINATSCELTVVIAAVSSASAGDTVVVPSGTCTWSNPLSITKAITLQGQGIGNTVLIDNVATGHMIFIETNTGTDWRLTGIEIRYGGVSKGSRGQLEIAGGSHAFRVDHNRFFGYPNQSHAIRFSGDLWGVIDHNEFDDNNNFAQALRGQHDLWGVVGAYGDNSWATPDNFGTNQFVFIEDNTFEGAGDTASGAQAGALDMFSGARIVFRHNTVNNDYVTSHGTETSQRERSCSLISETMLPIHRGGCVTERVSTMKINNLEPRPIPG